MDERARLKNGSDIHACKGGTMRRIMLALALVTGVLAAGADAQLCDWIYVNNRVDPGNADLGVVILGVDSPLPHAIDTVPEGIRFRWTLGLHGDESWAIDSLVFQPCCNGPLSIKRIRIHRDGQEVLNLRWFIARDSILWGKEDPMSCPALVHADTALIVHCGERILGNFFWYAPFEPFEVHTGDSMEMVFSNIPPLVNPSLGADRPERHGYRQAPGSAPPGDDSPGAGYYLVSVDGAVAHSTASRGAATSSSIPDALAPGVYFWRRSNGVCQIPGRITVIR